MFSLKWITFRSSNNTLQRTLWINGLHAALVFIKIRTSLRNIITVKRYLDNIAMTLWIHWVYQYFLLFIFLLRLKHFVSNWLINANICSQGSQYLLFDRFLDYLSLKFFLIDRFYEINVVFYLLLVFVYSVKSINSFIIYHFADVRTLWRFQTNQSFFRIGIIETICIVNSQGYRIL